jgi:type IV pilus assembly protein PilM
VAVPFASSLVKLIEVPPLDLQKLETVVPLEARKYIPVPISEVQLDYFVVPETEQKLFLGSKDLDNVESQEIKTKLVLIVAMHNETLRKYTETIKLAGLNPDFYEIEVFSNIRATVAHSLAPVAIIDLGAATSKLYLVELGIILASHVIPVGSQDITRSLAKSSHISIAKAEEIKRQAGILTGVSNTDAARVSHAATLTMEQIFAEGRRVLLGFQKKYNKVITKVVLTGGGASLKGLAEFARQQLELEIEIAEPFSHTQTPAFLEETLKGAGPDFTVSLGVALRRLHEQD